MTPGHVIRIVTYGAACSLDGFITAADGAIDWLHMSRDVEAVMRDYWATIDTILMGRKTFDFAMSHGGGGAKSSGLTTYVFSRTLTQVPRGTVLVAEHAGEFVRDLKTRPGKGIYLMGGGDLAQSLFGYSSRCNGACPISFRR